MRRVPLARDFVWHSLCGVSWRSYLSISILHCTAILILEKTREREKWEEPDLLSFLPFLLFVSGRGMQCDSELRGTMSYTPACRMMKWPAVIRLLAIVSIALPLRAQTQAPQATFRGGTDLVQVDVSVLDSKRHPVRGLKPEDFT